ncbi:MAG: hypothetical protein ABL927_01855 [Bdellovibrionales bacterium]
MAKQKKPIPFDFLLDELTSLSPRVNPMFGAYAVYVTQSEIPSEERLLSKSAINSNHKFKNLKATLPTPIEKIVFILRDHLKYPEDNGVWLCTTSDHHASLKKEFSSMRSIQLFSDGGPTGWQNLPVDAENFESEVLHACQLILKNDPRIGKIPKTKSVKLKPKRKPQKNRKKK